MLIQNRLVTGISCWYRLSKASSRHFPTRIPRRPRAFGSVLFIISKAVLASLIGIQAGSQHSRSGLMEALACKCPSICPSKQAQRVQYSAQITLLNSLKIQRRKVGWRTRKWQIDSRHIVSPRQNGCNCCGLGQC